ncbi:MAG: hypothetical protein ACJ8C3_26690, partial [Microvirga sp.]
MRAPGSGLRPARERDRELDALDVAIGKGRARPIGEGVHAERGEELYRLFAVAAARVRADGAGLAGMADQRHLDVLGDRHRREGLGDL